MKKINTKANRNELSIDYSSKKNNISVTESYINQGQHPYQQGANFYCYLCNKSINSNLIKICQCQNRSFHGNCAKQWLRQKIVEPQSNVDSDNHMTLLKCDKCYFTIRFKKQKDQRKRTCAQVFAYCGINKCYAVGIISVILLFIVGLLFLFLIGTEIVYVDNSLQGKWILMIVIGFCCLFLLIVLIVYYRQFCLTQDYVISNIHNLRAQRLKSFRNNQTRSPRQRSFERGLVEGPYE